MNRYAEEKLESGKSSEVSRLVVSECFERSSEAKARQTIQPGG
jgi:hypothetical protein